MKRTIKQTNAWHSQECRYTGLLQKKCFVQEMCQPWTDSRAALLPQSAAAYAHPSILFQYLYQFIVWGQN